MCVFFQKLQNRENIRKMAPSIKYMYNWPIICICVGKIVNNSLLLKVFSFWLHLYRARSKITQLLIPTHAHFHWLKFIKNI